MDRKLSVDRDSIVILAKTGRQSSWYQLSDAERRNAEGDHVDLMLSIATSYQLRRLEGFRLIGPQARWERFWVIEFPDLKGAEAWIEAEMAPPYGLYGFYENSLTRQLGRDLFNNWLPKPPQLIKPQTDDPAIIPPLKTDRSSVVVVQFSRTGTTCGGYGDTEHSEDLRRVAVDHRMLALEIFQLINPLEQWHRAWICEFPDLNGAEAWIEAEATPPRTMYAERTSYLARRWAPSYFAAWVPGQVP